MSLQASKPKPWAYMKLWPGGQWNGGVSLDQNHKITWGMEGILAFFSLSYSELQPPLCAPLVCDLQCVSPSPLSAWCELFGCLWRFILTDVLLSGESSLKAAEISAWELFQLEFSPEILFFFHKSHTYCTSLTLGWNNVTFLKCFLRHCHHVTCTFVKLLSHEKPLNVQWEGKVVF